MIKNKIKTIIKYNHKGNNIKMNIKDFKIKYK